jgi:hypothetical protein
MDSTAKARQAAFEKHFVGYLLAVTGAAVTALIQLFVSAYFSATNSSLSFARLWDGAFWIVLILFGLWVLAFVSAIIPFVATIKVARRFQITSVLYFILCGVLAGVVAAPAIIYFALAWYPRSTQPPFSNEIIDAWRLTIPAGIVGASLYWWKVGRHLTYDKPRS